MTGSLSRAISIAALLATAATAQTPPAPTIGPERDTDGRPLPFGRVPRLPANAPAGTGRYKAIMEAVPGLPAHVVYRPASLPRGVRLPVVAWGNGACINAGNRFRYFLTEIASHGYLVIANGVMADPALEVGPQENPPVRVPGAPPPPPPPPRDPNAPQRAPGTTTPQQLVEAIDWAEAEDKRAGSPLAGHVAADKVAVMGQSCGGVQTLAVAGDPRIDTLMVWNSGVGMIPNNPADPAAALRAIHTPVAYIFGEQARDVAYPAGNANVADIQRVPVFGAWQDGMTHLGTYGQANGGFFGRIAVNWLNWQLKGDTRAAAMFRGKDCTLCRDPSWHVAKQRID